MRRAYARALVDAQRYADAMAQLETVTRQQPDLAPPWLTLGALQLELRQPQAAEQSLQRYVQLVQAQARAGSAAGRRRPTTTTTTTSAGAHGPGPDPGLAAAGPGGRAARRLRRRRSLAGARRQPAARARGADAARLAAGAPGQGARGARTDAHACPSATPTTRAPSCSPKRRCCATSSSGPRPTTVLAARQPALPRRRRPALRAGDDGREARRSWTRWSAAAPRDRAQARPRSTPTTRWATRWPNATCAWPRRRTLIQKALELAPGEPFITDSLGWVEFRLGNREEALRLLRQAYTGAARRRDRRAPGRGAVGHGPAATRRAASGARRAAATPATTCCARPWRG